MIDDEVLSVRARALGRRHRAVHRPGVLLARVPPGVRGARLRARARRRWAGWRCPTARAYFCSRGSVMGQVPGEVVAAAFGVFNPAVVVPAGRDGLGARRRRRRSARRAPRARSVSSRRILGDEPDGLAGATELLAAGERAAAPRRPAAVRRPARPGPARRPDGRRVAARRPAARVPRRRAHRGVEQRRASTPPRSGCSPSSTGACRCGPTSARGRGATSDLDAAEARLVERGLVADGAFTDAGRAAREHVERGDRPAVPADHRGARRRLRRARRAPSARWSRQRPGRRRLSRRRAPTTSPVPSATASAKSARCTPATRR